MAREFHDGFKDSETAVLWVNHIRSAGDVFREGSGGLYDQIGAWVRKNSFGSGKRLADICCGEGASTKQAAFLGAHVTGIDFSLDLVDSASIQYVNDRNLDFAEGDATDLRRIFPLDGSVDGALMINGIFHLPPCDMLNAVRELGRITAGPVLITTVNGQASEIFASAFENRSDMAFAPEPAFPFPSWAIIGDPVISGPEGGKITLKDVPFVAHPIENIAVAAAIAGLKIESTITFARLPDSAGGVDLFRAIELQKVEI